MYAKSLFFSCMMFSKDAIEYSIIRIPNTR